MSDPKAKAGKEGAFKATVCGVYAGTGIIWSNCSVAGSLVPWALKINPYILRQIVTDQCESVYYLYYSQQQLFFSLGSRDFDKCNPRSRYALGVESMSRLSGSRWGFSDNCRKLRKRLPGRIYSAQLKSIKPRLLPTRWNWLCKNGKSALYSQRHHFETWQGNGTWFCKKTGSKYVDPEQSVLIRRIMSNHVT